MRMERLERSQRRAHPPVWYAGHIQDPSTTQPAPYGASPASSKTGATWQGKGHGKDLPHSYHESRGSLQNSNASLKRCNSRAKVAILAWATPHHCKAMQSPSDVHKKTAAFCNTMAWFKSLAVDGMKLRLLSAKAGTSGLQGARPLINVAHVISCDVLRILRQIANVCVERLPWARDCERPKACAKPWEAILRHLQACGECCWISLQMESA